MNILNNAYVIMNISRIFKLRIVHEIKLIRIILFIGHMPITVLQTARSSECEAISCMHPKELDCILAYLMRLVLK